MEKLYKNINLVFNVTLLSFIISTQTFGGELRDDAIIVINNSFNNDITVETFKLKINGKLKKMGEQFAGQRFYGDFVYYYKIIRNKKLLGYAVLDNVVGKVKPITFLVIFSIDFSVKKVEIIKYREEHGREVQNRSWLNQFKGKMVNSDLELNNGIDGISGATISVNSIIKGVKRLLSLINNMGDDEKYLLVSVE